MRGGASKVPNAAVGVLAILLIAVGVGLAFTKDVPLIGDPYEVRATFAETSGLRPDSQVRIAGIAVGKVTDVEHVATEPGQGTGGEAEDTAATVTMEISEEGLPLHEDATFSLRPRLFLEGNLFVDVRPGSPDAEEVDEGHAFGLDQTATYVQVDQVLTTLQEPVREQLQVVLAELGSALTEHGGAEGLRRFFATSPRAFSASALLSEAFLGTEPHDLSGSIRNLGRVMRGLGRDEPALQGLVSNLRTVAGALAAEEVALERSVELLPDTLATARPTLAELNRALPPARALAVEALPGVEGVAPALSASTPWVQQLDALASRPELGGLASDLRAAAPDLALLTDRTPPVLNDLRPLSSCLNEVVNPWSADHVDDPFQPASGTVIEETGYGLAGVAGESRNHDANAPYIRALSGSGTNFVEFPPAAGRPEEVFGLTPYPLLGAMPSLASSAKTAYRPDVPCETQEPPDLRALTGRPPTQSSAASAAAAPAAEPIAEMVERWEGILGDYAAAAELEQDGDKRAGRKAMEEATAEHVRLEEGPLARLEQEIRELGGRGG